MTKTPPPVFPVVPALWPFGEGVLMLGDADLSDGRVGLLVRGLSDDLLAEESPPLTQETWERCAGSPQLILAFKDVGSLDNFIAFAQQTRRTYYG